MKYTPKSIEEAHAKGTLNFNCMSYIAINHNLDLLRAVFDLALQNGIKSITVNTWTKDFDTYLSDVLHFVFSHMVWMYNCISESNDKKCEKWIRDAKDFISHVRKHCKINYNPSISWVISDGYNRDSESNKKVLGYLFDLADEDQNEIDFQKHMNHILERLRYCHQFVRDEAKKRNYKFNWQKIAYSHADIRKIVEWANEDSQKVRVDCQVYLENSSVHHNKDLTLYYLEMAKREGQTIDHNKILDLVKNEEIRQMIINFAGPEYVPLVYHETLTIDLKSGKTDTGITFNSNVLDDLYRFAMECTSITSIEYQNKRYYERTSMWGGSKGEGNPPKRPKYDPDLGCGGYWEGECEHLPSIYPEDPSEVTYHIDYDKAGIGWNDEKLSNKELIRTIQHLDPNNVKLTGFETLTLTNLCGENDDHRGSNHCQVYLEFYSDFQMDLPVSLMDFMENCYRIKSHKWDKWYELYCGGKVDCEYLGNSIEFSASFDHGS